MGSDIIRNHLRNGEFELARVGAELALATAKEEDRGVLYALLSRAWQRLGRPRDALAAAEEGARRSDHWEISLAVGEALLAVGEPMAARALLREALEIARGKRTSAIRATADEEAGWVTAQVDLGAAFAEACRAAGDPEAGLDVATRAVVLAERTFGPNSLEAAEALHAVGVCLSAAGHLDEARAPLHRALDIRRSHNPEHTDVAATLDALGALARKRDHPFDAVALHREALALWTRRLGPHAGPVSACHHALAHTVHATGDFVTARDEMRTAWEIAARTFGTEHLDTQITAFELARYDVDCGEFRGFADMRRARDAVAGKLGSIHPVVKAMDRWL